jgi:hypothetical protein
MTLSAGAAHLSAFYFVVVQVGNRAFKTGRQPFSFKILEQDLSMQHRSACGHITKTFLIEGEKCNTCKIIEDVDCADRCVALR